MKQLFHFKTDNTPEFRISRTAEGTIFELVTLVLVVAMWCVAAWAFVHSPEQVATHFDLKGVADSYGERWNILIVALIATLLVLFLVAAAYAPQRMTNLPVKIKTPKQHLLASRMIRILALLITVLFTCVVLMMAFPGSALPLYLLYFFTAITIIVPLVFTMLVYKARSRE